MAHVPMTREETLRRLDSMMAREQRVLVTLAKQPMRASERAMGQAETGRNVLALRFAYDTLKVAPATVVDDMTGQVAS